MYNIFKSFNKKKKKLIINLKNLLIEIRQNQPQHTYLNFNFK